MAPNFRAQKKRKTETATIPANAQKSKPAPVDDDIETGGVALDAADDSDKYDSAEEDSEDEVDEYELGSESDDEEGSGNESDDSITSLMAAQGANKKKRKRNDSESFSLSMSKILGSHLTTTARKDPVLVRAKQTQDHVDDGKLEAKARRIMKDELRKEKEKGRIRELIPKDDDVAAGKAIEKERILKSIARSGVAKLYNAVRAAQIKGEEAAKEAQKEGLVGMSNREAKVTEMSKQGFLDLIQSAK